MLSIFYNNKMENNFKTTIIILTRNNKYASKFNL